MAIQHPIFTVDNMTLDKLARIRLAGPMSSLSSMPRQPCGTGGAKASKHNLTWRDPVLGLQALDNHTLRTTRDPQWIG